MFGADAKVENGLKLFLYLQAEKKSFLVLSSSSSNVVIFRYFVEDCVYFDVASFTFLGIIIWIINLTGN